MEAFVYRWRNRTDRTWYIGYHKGRADDGYICSSRSARPAILTNPADWERKILRWGTQSEMVALEHRILKRLSAASNPRSLNRSQGYPKSPRNPGRKPGQANRVKLESRNRFKELIRQRTGKSYVALLAEDYWRVVATGDKKLTKRYHGLFTRLWGPLWFEPIGIHNLITDQQSILSVKEGFI